MPHPHKRILQLFIFLSSQALILGCQSTSSTSSHLQNPPTRTTHLVSKADALPSFLLRDLARLSKVPSTFLSQLRTQVKRLPKDNFPDEEKLHFAFNALSKAGQQSFNLAALQKSAQKKLGTLSLEAQRYLNSPAYFTLESQLAQLHTRAGQVRLMAFLRELPRNAPDATQLSLLKKWLRISNEAERITQVSWDSTWSWTQIAHPHLPYPLNSKKILSLDEKRGKRKVFFERVLRTRLIEFDFIFRQLGQKELREHLRFWSSPPGLLFSKKISLILHLVTQEALQKSKDFLTQQAKL